MVTGLIKDTYVDMYKHLTNNLKDHRIDFYLSTWDIKGNFKKKYYSNNKNNYYINDNKISETDIEKLKELFKPKELVIDNFDLFKKNNEKIIENISTKSKTEYTRNLSTFSQHFKISRLKDKIKDNYDFILKTRFDLFLHNTIKFENNNNINALHDNRMGNIGHHKVYYKDKIYEISDHIIYTKQNKNLDIFFNFFNYLKYDLINENFILDKFRERVFPEFLLSYYLKNNDIIINNGNVKYTINGK